MSHGDDNNYDDFVAGVNGNTFDADPPKEDQSVEDPKHPTEEDADEPSNNNDALIDEDENNDNELVINPASRI